MTRRAPLPPGFVRTIDLVGVKPVSFPVALDNWTRLVNPMGKRRGRPGLVPLNAPALWQAVRAGTFPAPSVGAYGIAWPIEAIDRWRQQHMKTPPAVSAAGGVGGDSKRNKADGTRRTQRKQVQCFCTRCVVRIARERDAPKRGRAA